MRLTRPMESIKLDSKISWCVVVACACMNFLIMLPVKVSGLFFVQILDRYQVSRSIAGYPAFTSSVIRCSGGPFAGYFAERFGLNELMIFGSVMSSVGIAACFFAEDIATVIIFLGVCHGCGLACNYTLLPQIVKVHFKKYISLGFGVTQAGSCIGAFFTPPLLMWIFRSYGTSGGFFIIGAMVLNSLPIVMILNILSPNRCYGKSGDSLKSKEYPEGHQELVVANAVFTSENEDNNITDNIGVKKDVKVREENVVSETQNNLENKCALVLNISKCGYVGVIPEKTDDVPLSCLNEISTSSVSVTETDSETEKDRLQLECGFLSEIQTKNVINEKELKLDHYKNTNELQNGFKVVSNPGMDIRAKLMTHNCEENLQHSNDYAYSKSKYESKPEIIIKDVLQSQLGDAKDCNPSKDNDSYTSPCASGSNAPDSSNLVDSGKTQRQFTTEAIELISQGLSVLNPKSLELMKPNNHEINQKEVFKTNEQPKIGSTDSKSKTAKKSLTIFLDFTFWIVIITQSFSVFVLVLFWTTMIDFARDKNIDRSKEVYLLMTLPVAELIGRLCLAWITDKKYLTAMNFCNISFILMGCSCSLMAWAQNFYVVMTSIFLFGVISSGLITMLPMVIYDFFDSDMHMMGQASRFCLFGPLSFLNGPLIGYFRDGEGSYVWLYHTIAIVSVMCAVLSLLIPVLARTRDERKKKQRS